MGCSESAMISASEPLQSFQPQQKPKESAKTITISVDQTPVAPIIYAPKGPIIRNNPTVKRASQFALSRNPRLEREEPKTMIIKELSKPQTIKPVISKQGGPMLFFAEGKGQGKPDLSSNSENARRFEMANKLSDAANWTGCRKELQKISPQDDIILNRIGQTYYMEEDNKTAIEIYKKSLEVNPRNMESFALMGIAYQDLEIYDITIQFLNTAMELAGERASWLKHLGWAYFFKKEYAAAADAMVRSLEMDPDNLYVMEAAGLSFFRNKQYEKAIKYYKMLIDCDSDATKIHNLLSQAYYQLHFEDEAVKMLIKSYTKDPYQSQTCRLMGKNLNALKRYKEAKDWIQKAIDLNDESELTFSEMGYVCQNTNQPTEALEWYKKAQAIDKKNSSTLQRMGDLYQLLDDNASAIKYYRKALKVNPENGTAAFNLGTSYFNKGHYKQASIYFKKSAKLKESDYLCCLMSGQSLHMLGEHQEAISYLKKAIEINPNDPLTYYYLGSSLFNVQNFTDSHKAFLKCKDLHDNGFTSEQDSAIIKEGIDKFIKNASDWEEKEKKGFVCEEDRKKIQQMKDGFSKAFKSKFKVSSSRINKANLKVNTNIVTIARLIKKDYFELQIGSDSAPIFKIAALARDIYGSDRDIFQAFAYIFGQFVWLQRYQKEAAYQQIESQQGTVVSALVKKYPPTNINARSQAHVSLPAFPELKFNLFSEKEYFSSYETLVKEIESVNAIAKKDFSAFQSFVYDLERSNEGSHAKVGMKLPQKKDNDQDDEYEHAIFKVLIRIFEKMFKELKGRREVLYGKIQEKMSEGKLPLYGIIQAIMGVWIEGINKVLKEREQKRIPTECYITDLVRGKCMFASVPKVQAAAERVIEMCKERKYEVAEIDNRLAKNTQDVVFKIKTPNAIAELQLALDFDTVAFDFNHSFYEIERCPLGYIFGSCLYLSKDVDLSFLQQVHDTLTALRAQNSPSMSDVEALTYVLEKFEQSSAEFSNSETLNISSAKPIINGSKFFMNSKKPSKECPRTMVIKQMSQPQTSKPPLSFNSDQTITYKTAKNIKRPDFTPNTLNAKLLAKANKLIDEEDWPGCRKELLKIQPQDDYVLNRIGETYYMEDDNQTALQYYKKSLEIDGSNMETFALMGIAYEDKEFYDITVDFMKMAIEQYGERASWLKHLGWAYFFKKEYAAAADAMVRSLEMDPDNLYVMEAAELSFFRNKQYEKAIKYFKTILELEPRATRVLNSFSDIYFQQQKGDQSIKMLTQSYSIDPGNSETCKLMGKNLNALKRYKEAKGWLEKAINLDRQSEQIYSQMGYACQNNQELNEALQWYKKAQEINAEDAVTLQRIEDLNKIINNKTSKTRGRMR